MEKLLLLGENFPALSELYPNRLGRCQACISAGADPASPSLVHKGDGRFPNEDALLVLKQEERWLLAVADGHHGREASHELLVSLALRCRRIPERLAQLSLLLLGHQWSSPAPAGSALAIACYSESSRGVFGFSYGDCSVATLGEERFCLRNTHNSAYLYCGDELPLEAAEPFEFTLEADHWLLLYSDGINECCYREPQRSIQPRHMLQLGSEPARELAELALRGVDGHPGGQDNLAVLAIR